MAQQGYFFQLFERFKTLYFDKK